MRRARTGARPAALLVVALLAGAARGARAEGPGATRTPRLEVDAPLPLLVSAADGAPVGEAQAHFRRGVQLYAGGDPTGALVELKRAYALVPNFRILFNLGQVAYQCGDHAAAFGYLTRYLTEAGSGVPDGRRKEVAGELVELRARVGFLSIETQDPALRVTVDDADVGVTPLAAPIAANAGKRRIDLVASSGARQTRTIDLAPGEILSVAFPALPPAAVAPAARPSANDRARSAPATAPVELPPVIELPRAPPALPPLARTPQPAEVAPRPPGPHLDGRSGRVPWVTWTLAAVAAGGAAATGTLAWSAAQALREKAGMYPARASELQDIHDRERRYALASDGFLAGAVILSAVALYLTLTRPSGSGEGAGAASVAARGGW